MVSKKTLFSIALVIASVLAAPWCFRSVVGLRRPIFSGVCADYDCLAQVPQLSAVLPLLPSGARSVSYYKDGDLFEATFPISECDFIEWAVDQGWARDGIRRNVNDARLFLHAVGNSGELVIHEGYYLETLRLKDSMEVRALVYDALHKTAYLQLWASEFDGNGIVNAVR